MSKQIIGAIDGDLLVESINASATDLYDRGGIVPSGVLVILRDEIEAGKFSLPSDQGETTRLREALTQISSYQRDQYESPLNAYDNCKQIAREALSSHREGGIQQARTQEEWHEDFGDVLWWTFPIEEPPYVGSPLDSDWPGYHTHWTVIPIPGITEER